MFFVFWRATHNNSFKIIFLVQINKVHITAIVGVLTEKSNRHLYSDNNLGNNS